MTFTNLTVKDLKKMKTEIVFEQERFGPEWTKEMKRWPKDLLIGKIRDLLTELDQLRKPESDLK